MKSTSQSWAPVHGVVDRLAPGGDLGVVGGQGGALHPLLHARHRGRAEISGGLGDVGQRRRRRELGHGQHQGRIREDLAEIDSSTVHGSVGRQIAVVGAGGREAHQRPDLETALGAELGEGA